MDNNTVYTIDAANVSYGSLQLNGTAPSPAASWASGWIVGTHVAGDDSLFLYGTIRAASTFTTGALPSTTPNGSDSLLLSAAGGGPITAVFAGGNWTVATSWISVNSAGLSGAVHINYRLYRCASDGSSAVELTSGAVAGSQMSAFNQNDIKACTATLISGAPPIILTAEYLILQMACHIDTASGAAAAQLKMRTTASPGTNNRILAPLMMRRRRLHL